MTTDLKSMTNGELVDLATDVIVGIDSNDAAYSTASSAVDELARRLEAVTKERDKNDNKIDALDDEVAALQERLEEAQQRSEAHDAEVAADVIKAVQSTWPVTNAIEFKAWLDAKAAEYRAKAGRKE